MLALCSMLRHTYYAQNYASIIHTGLTVVEKSCSMQACSWWVWLFVATGCMWLERHVRRLVTSKCVSLSCSFWVWLG